MLSRRWFLAGAASAFAAPAIVRVESLMPVRGIIMDVESIPGFPSVKDIRAFLLPGLWDLRANCEMIPRQWARYFTMEEMYG